MKDDEQYEVIAGELGAPPIMRSTIQPFALPRGGSRVTTPMVPYEIVGLGIEQTNFHVIPRAGGVQICKYVKLVSEGGTRDPSSIFGDSLYTGYRTAGPNVIFVFGKGGGTRMGPALDLSAVRDVSTKPEYQHMFECGDLVTLLDGVGYYSLKAEAVEFASYFPQPGEVMAVAQNGKIYLHDSRPSAWRVKFKWPADQMNIWWHVADRLTVNVLPPTR